MLVNKVAKSEIVRANIDGSKNGLAQYKATSSSSAGGRGDPIVVSSPSATNFRASHYTQC
jgi:hypothetical protein